MAESLDVFGIHKNVIEEYKSFVESFINIKDERIKQKVEDEILKGKYWPEPLLQFNPSFEYGEDLESLCQSGIFHQEMSKTFNGYKLFRHQIEALKLGAAGKDFVVTSGTGSGKSFTFLGTIFNDILTNPPEKSIKAS